MLSKKIIKLFLIIFLGAVFCSVPIEGKTELEKFLKKISEEILGKNLVRKDLLFEKSERLNPPKRNIFSPLKKRKSGAGPVSEEVEGEFRKGASKSKMNALEIIPDIRYIGYITSSHKIVALIIFEGEALAVEEREKISSDIKIGKISLKEIEIIDSESKIRKYSLEGEE